jgi:hypothetical protein
LATVIIGKEITKNCLFFLVISLQNSQYNTHFV